MQQTNKIRLKGTIIHMEVSRKRIMYTIATNVGINHAQPDVALIVKDNVKKEDIKFVPGDRVKISAHVQYSKQENNEETEYLKTLVIDEMETADSTEQDVFDLDEVGQEDVNKGMFVGRVVHMFDVPKKENCHFIYPLSGIFKLRGYFRI